MPRSKDEWVKTRETGVYRERSDETKYQLRTKVQGRQRTRVVYASSLAEAAIARAEWRRDLLEDRDPTPQRAECVTDYAARWVEGKRRTSWSKRKTAVTMTDRLATALETHTADILCADLRRSDAAELVRRLEARRKPDGTPYARDTLHGAWRVWSSMAKDLAAEYDIADPTRRVLGPTKGRRKVREHETLTPAQLATVLGHLREHAAADVWLACRVASYTGVRGGELAGMMASDVHWSERRWRVQRSVTVIGRRWESGPPKGGERDVYLDAETCALLREHVVRSGELGGIVFPASNGGWRRYNVWSNAMLDAAADSGVPVRVGLQVLRRTYNTLAQRLGDAVALRDQMGHVEEGMTERYSRAAVAERVALVDGMARLLGAGGG